MSRQGWFSSCVSQLRLLILRFDGWEFGGWSTLSSSLFVFFVNWLIPGRGSQVNHEGTKESCQETDPVDQDTLRWFGRVLRVLAVIREERILDMTVCWIWLGLEGCWRNIIGTICCDPRSGIDKYSRQTREKSEWKTRGGEATEGFSRGFFSSLEWIFEILLSEAQHIVIIPRFLVANNHSIFNIHP